MGVTNNFGLLVTLPHIDAGDDDVDPERWLPLSTTVFVDTPTNNKV